MYYPLIEKEHLVQLLEALSTGRPIITTDVPGCRETVIHKKNGLLVPVKMHDSFSKSYDKFIKRERKYCSNG
jgi:glycosyltransferase involved in cell wall biosynthesis